MPRGTVIKVRGDVMVYPRDAVLTKAQVARALSVGPRQVERADLPTVYIGKQTPRYLWGQVLDFLAKRAR
jgi:hypothetical protein